jgi:uncharacterized protein (TIGR03084 family)
VAHLGVATRRFSFTNHGLEAPVEEAYAELDSGVGEVWSFGSPDATDRVTGSALDFCLVVTQRRTVGQTGLLLTGRSTNEWLSVAQAFAGPPTTATPR